MKKDNAPIDLGPISDVWTLVSAFTDAMNLRHLREELYGESPDLAPPRRSRPHRLGEPHLARQAASFDPGLAYIGLQRAYIDMPGQHARAKIDVSQ
jgi:hypothetical protein